MCRRDKIFSSRGLRRGDAVAIYMTSQPVVVAIQMGLAKIGVISSLINSNLTGEVRHQCGDFISQITFQSIVRVLPTASMWESALHSFLTGDYRIDS